MCQVWRISSRANRALPVILQRTGRAHPVVDGVDTTRGGTG